MYAYIFALVLLVPQITLVAEHQVYRGTASWYGEYFQNRIMANGHPYNRFALTCASRDLPLGSTIYIVNPHTFQHLLLKVTDRGPYFDTAHRILDLSEYAAKQLGCYWPGTCEVLFTVVEGK